MLVGLPSHCSVSAALPLPSNDGLSASGAESPQEMCLAVNAWSAFMLVVAIPLLISCPLERHARRRFLAAQQAGLRAGGQGPGPSRPPEAAADAAVGLPRLPLTGSWAVDVYLCSYCLWELSGWLAWRQLGQPPR